MGLIAQGFGQTDATGRRLIHAFETQRAAGFGAIAEGGDFKGNVPIDGAQGSEWIKYMNLYFELTGPAQATIQNGEGSYVDIVERHVSSIARTAKNQAERIFTGTGNASLCQITGTYTTAAAGSTVPNVTGPAFFDTQFIQKGQVVQFCAQTLTGTNTIMTLHDLDGTVLNATIAATTKGSKRAGTYGTVTLAEATSGTGSIATGDHLVIANSYAWSSQADGATANHASCLEPNGIGNLVSDGVLNSETSGFYTENWGLDRTAAGNAFLQSHMYDAGNQELDEEIMLEAIMENQALYQGNPNLLLVSARAMLKYFVNSKEDRRFNTMDAMGWTGGYSGMGIQLGSKKLMLTTVNSAPTGLAFMINTADFAFLRPPGMSGFKWLTGEGGGVLTQKHASDNKFASAVDYVQLVCYDPGRQTKIFGISE
jgi:hypothetical protein